MRALRMSPLARVGIDSQIVGDLAAEAAEFVVDSMVEPEGQDVGEQLRLHLLSHQLHESTSLRNVPAGYASR